MPTENQSVKVTELQAKEIDYHRQRMAPLVGATLTQADVSIDQDFGFEIWPVLIFTKPDGTQVQCEISRDPAGNGPGFLFIEGDR